MITWQASGSLGETADVEAPLQYGDPSSTLKLRVRRYTQGKTARLVYLIVGGPGQDPALWEAQLPALWSIFGSSATFIVVDHRGTGGSGALAADTDTSWYSNWSAFQTKYPITAITTSNVGRDLVRVAELLQEEYSGIPHFLVGSSYGTRVAISAVNAAPDLFEGALLDGLDMENATSSLSTVTGTELLENCARNAYCKRVVGDPLALPALIPKLDPGLNECTAIFFGKMAGVAPGAAPCDLLGAIFYQLMISSGRSTADRRQIPAMWIVALLAQFSDCTNTGIATTLSDRILKRISSGGTTLGGTRSATASDAGVSGHEEARFSKSPHAPTCAQLGKVSSLSLAGVSERPNMLVHAYVSASERWRGSVPSYCATCTPRLFKICSAHYSYATYAAVFGSSLYTPDGLSQSALNSGKTRVVVLAGELDYNTPIGPVSSMVTLMRSPYKRIVRFANRGHGLLQDSPCIRAAVAELFGGSAGTTDACVAKQNAVTLDWEGQDGGSDMAGIFKEPPTSAEISSNAAVSEGGGGNLMLILCSVVLVLIIAGGIGYFVWRKKQSAAVRTKQ